MNETAKQGELRFRGEAHNLEMFFEGEWCAWSTQWGDWGRSRRCQEARDAAVAAFGKDHKAAVLLAEAAEALKEILKYEPREVVKDEFAYDRMVEAYRVALDALLSRIEKAEVTG